MRLRFIKEEAEENNDNTSMWFNYKHVKISLQYNGDKWGYKQIRITPCSSQNYNSSYNSSYNLINAINIRHNKNKEDFIKDLQEMIDDVSGEVLRELVKYQEYKIEIEQKEYENIMKFYDKELIMI